MNDGNFIEIRDLAVTLGQASIISGVNLNIGRKECISIIGPNGAGKSTLAKVATGMLQPTSGSVSIHERPLQGLTALARSELIAYVPQRAPHLPPFSVRRYLELSRYRFNKVKTVRPAKTIDYYADQWSISKYLTRTIDTLSGGELQRVLLAGAAVQESDLLVLDEPTTFLDISGREDVLKTLEAWKQSEEKSLLMVTHDLVASERISDRVVGMKGGRLVGEAKSGSDKSLELLKATFDRDFARVPIPGTERSSLLAIPK